MPEKKTGKVRAPGLQLPGCKEQQVLWHLLWGLCRATVHRLQLWSPGMFGSRALMGVLRSALWNEQPRRRRWAVCTLRVVRRRILFVEVVIACLSGVYS